MSVIAAVAAVVAVCCWPSPQPMSVSWCRGGRDDPAAAPAGLARRVFRRPWTRVGDSGSSRQRAPVLSSARPPDVAVAMDLLALVAASGRSVLDAMDRVASVSPARVRADLATVIAAQGWGVRNDDAWLLVGAAWEPAATALSLASTAGLAPSGILVRAAADIRSAHAEALDVAAARLGVRLVLPLGLAFLPAFVLLTVVPLVVALATQLLG